MTDAPELKPCPFCGGAAHLAIGQHTFEGSEVFCNNCYATEGSYEDDPKGKRAIAGWNTRADLSDAKDARIAELEAAIKRQAGAAMTLRNSTLAEVQHIKDRERKEYAASKTLDSERDANAILTEENEALQARIAELEAERDALHEGLTAAYFAGAHREKARAEAAEAKLAVADGALFSARPALEHAIYLLPENANQIRGIKGALAKVEATLAQLKGTDQ